MGRTNRSKQAVGLSGAADKLGVYSLDGLAKAMRRKRAARQLLAVHETNRNVKKFEAAAQKSGASVVCTTRGGLL